MLPRVLTMLIFLSLPHRLGLWLQELVQIWFAARRGRSFCASQCRLLWVGCSTQNAALLALRCLQLGRGCLQRISSITKSALLIVCGRSAGPSTSIATLDFSSSSRKSCFSGTSCTWVSGEPFTSKQCPCASSSEALLGGKRAFLALSLFLMPPTTS